MLSRPLYGTNTYKDRTNKLHISYISNPHPEDEPDFLGRAHEPDPVLEGEVDDAGRVHGVQDVDHEGEAVHAVVKVAVLGLLGLKEQRD